ncbi:MAG: homoserine kinase [Elusimicrobia bacterium]|nr:homoserine kinase [Elusimicrobiota bacterium]
MRLPAVRVRVPATTSNLGPGVDVFGRALSLHPELELRVSTTRGEALVEIEGEGASTLPRGEDNEVVRVLRRVCHIANGLRLRLTNRIPVARGLGSSAAARLAALLAARAVWKEPSTEGDSRENDSLLDQACALEGHPDNVVPALLGGLRLSVRDGDRLLQVPLKSPKGLAAVVCVPDFELSTEKARAVLPATVDRADAVFTSGRVALLVHALETGRYELLRVAMQDVLHQPYRRALVPGLRTVLEEAAAAGAFGAALSGAGPSVLAFAPRGARAAAVGRAMQRGFLNHRIESRALALDVDRKGAVAERIE